MPERAFGPDPTELHALHEQQLTLEAALLEAVEDCRPPAYLGLLYRRIALLDAELRRN